MVNLLTGPKGSGKTQQMIELANQQAKACNGNVVFIKNSHHDTSSVTFDIRVVCMDDYEAIIIPGGPEWKALEASQEVQNWLKAFNEAGKYVCAICAGPTILGRGGFLKGKNYTCFTSMNDDFGGTYHQQYVVKDGNIITGCSAAASIDFGFAILEAVAGKEAADKTKAEIYYNYK